MLSTWSINPFSELSKVEIASYRDLVNEANRAYPRIFPGDRLKDGSLEEGYSDCLVVGLHEGKRLIGCVFLRWEGGVMWILLLAVSAKSQGRNLGVQLLNKSVEIGESRGSTTAKLQAVGENLTAFYLRNGFQEEIFETMPVGQWGSPVEFPLWTLIKTI